MTIPLTFILDARLGILEDEVYAEQYTAIREMFGERAATYANYGWAVDCLPNESVICTKIYGYGTVTTSTDYPDEHIFE